MEENKNFKGLYMNITLLKDRLRISQNKGYINKAVEDVYEEVMIEDIDLNHVEFSPARSMIIQGYLIIPLKKKLVLPNIFKGKVTEIKIWFKRDGNEPFEELRELLMAMR